MEGPATKRPRRSRKRSVRTVSMSGPDATRDVASKFKRGSSPPDARAHALRRMRQRASCFIPCSWSNFASGSGILTKSAFRPLLLNLRGVAAIASVGTMLGISTLMRYTDGVHFGAQRSAANHRWSTSDWLDARAPPDCTETCGGVYGRIQEALMEPPEQEWGQRRSSRPSRRFACRPLVTWLANTVSSRGGSAYWAMERLILARTSMVMRPLGSNASHNAGASSSSQSCHTTISLTRRTWAHTASISGPPLAVRPGIRYAWNGARALESTKSFPIKDAASGSSCSDKPNTFRTA
eukprot:scaffold264482_cov33-Tisochrysis_lutea.AAC.2